MNLQPIKAFFIKPFTAAALVAAFMFTACDGGSARRGGMERNTSEPGEVSAQQDEFNHGDFSSRGNTARITPEDSVSGHGVGSGEHTGVREGGTQSDTTTYSPSASPAQRP
jgi:hypothetical protein